ncbi:MAG: hypothetical protein J5704_03645 [Paludibacteraceae bacterium]|nr:hypothetical protein [Paludibacteraceae bacterium]
MTALQELRELRIQEKAIKARIDSIKDQAAIEAQAFTDGGKFEFLGHHYTLDVDEIYDLIGKPQKYTMPEAVTYRQKAKEQKSLKTQSAALTAELRTIRENFPANHPNIEPDEVNYSVKCLD